MRAKYGWSVVPRGKNKGKVYKRDCPETLDLLVFDTRQEAIEYSLVWF